MGATAFASAVLFNFGFILGKLSPSNQELSQRLKVYKYITRLVVDRVKLKVMGWLWWVGGLQDSSVSSRDWSLTKKCCNGHVFLLLSLLANRFLTDDYKIVVENKFLSKIFRTDRYIYGLYF